MPRFGLMVTPEGEYVPALKNEAQVAPGWLGYFSPVQAPERNKRKREKMAGMRQSPQLREQLDAKWQAHPAVQAFRAALKEFAEANNLEFDPEGMTRTAKFANQWLKDHGPLPESGIWIG